mgnify:CR=1 FL=1
MNLESNYYDIAVENLNAACSIMKCANDNDAQFKRAGYFVQQSVELAIKYILFENGIDQIRTKTHDLAMLVRMAKEENIDLFLNDFLLQYIYTITEWEEKTRYMIGYYVAQEIVERAIKETYNYLKTIKEKIL